MKFKRPSDYRSPEEYYNVESDLGRKQFLEKYNKEQKVKAEKQKVVNILYPKKKNIFERIDLSKPSQKINLPKNIQVGSNFSKEQRFLQEMFGGGERTFGTGQNLPRMNGAIIPNVINENEDGTALCFGVSRNKTRTGGFFGI